MMDLMDAMLRRHSVRAYVDRPLAQETVEQLKEMIARCNAESGLHIQLITDEPKAFASRMARYGQFHCVRNYIAMVGPKTPELDEKCGYYGEKLVLFAQQLGLNTCWVGLTYKKTGDISVAAGEKLVLVISLGYGVTQGVPHRSKHLPKVCRVAGEMPEWFRLGMEAALLAPTALNQQKFFLTLEGAGGGKARVSAKAGVGFYTKVDLGIVKYHFELGAGTENFVWA